MEPDVDFSSTVTPGSPSSPGSTLPCTPPPGLKSRQTVPVIAPGFLAGTMACLEPLGICVGGMPVSASNAVSPGRRGDLRTMPVDDVPVTLGPEGSASDSAPGGQIASCTAPIAALTAPCDGSCWYITCQITPAANSDTAIGMNTAVLNATDHAMRSVSTANTSPIAVTVAGTTATQIALFSIALRIDGVVNSAW